MNRRALFISGLLITGSALWIGRSRWSRAPENASSPTAAAKAPSYWTCPMHPQIHQDHGGECPICHMKLVPVKNESAPIAESDRADVQATSSQLSLIGVQKTLVERMDLSLAVPVAGRLLSPSSIAFQVYESDLGFVKAGLPFRGRSSFVPNGEISGTITAVDTIVDPTSRTVRVVGRIDRGPKGLIAETTFSGAVEIALKNRVAIPESSVLHAGTSDLVYVFTENGQLTPRPVTLGPKTEGFYEILAGLEPGESISAGPNFLIDSEAKIRGAGRAAP